MKPATRQPAALVLAAALLAAAALPLSAQQAPEDGEVWPDEADHDSWAGEGGFLQQPPEVVQTRVASARGAVLRGLDKMAGRSQDMPLAVGESVALGPLTLTLQECRHPADDPAADAYARLSVTAGPAGGGGDGDTVLFDGWMIASSPALHALDHPRFDVWVLRCTTS